MQHEEVWRRIRAAGGQADWPEVHRLAYWTVEQVNLPASVYTRAARALSDAYAGLGNARCAAIARLVGGDPPGAFQLVAMHPAEAAIVCRALGDLRASGERFVQAGLPAQAAVAFEHAGDPATARVLWDRLLGEPRLRSDPYVQALVAFNHGRCCARVEDRKAARRSFVRAVGLLEEAADEFATRGERERAFDCYQVVLTLGRDEKQFENVAEGFLNSVRILREDLLKYWALHYIEEFLEECARRSEYHAAATLLREAAEYCHRQGLEYERWYRGRSAAAWEQTAEHTIATGAPPELAENALLAAVDAWSSIGCFPRVRDSYLRLSQLPLAEARRERYARIAAKFEGAPDESGKIVPFPEHLRKNVLYPDVWHADVVEWEQGGDPAALAADLVADPRNPQTTQRLAFVCYLMAVETPSDDVSRLGKLAEQISRLQVWAALSPLERLFSSNVPAVRAAAVRATRSLYFKRSFVIVKRALDDPAEEVRKEALEAVRDLRFAHAFDPLVQIFRRSRDRSVRLTALRSIGAINAIEAAECLLDVLRSDEPPLREEAGRVLADMQVQELDDMLVRALSSERGPTAAHLSRVLRARGHSPGV